MKKLFQSQINKLILVTGLYVGLKVFDLDIVVPPLIALSAAGGDCSCSCSCGCGNDAASLYSTPFICTWDGSQYNFENDILFGKPNSLFLNKEQGFKDYEAGKVTGDLYKLNNKIVTESGKVKLQIKEIEPEESYIDYLSLARVTYPKDAELIVNSNFNGYTIFKKKELNEKAGIYKQSVFTHDKNDITTLVNGFSDDSGNEPHKMDAGESIVLKGQVKDKNNPVYFIMGSLYRDWTLGEIFEHKDTSEIYEGIKDLVKREMPIRSRFVLVKKVVSLSVTFGLLSVAGGLQGLFSLGGTHNSEEGVSKLAGAFGVETAHADIPTSGGVTSRSLVVEFLEGDTFKQVEVVQPRYYQRVFDSIRLPANVIQDDGSITLRVRATKRHHVTSAFLVAPSELVVGREQEYTLSKVVRKGEDVDNTSTPQTKFSGGYLHTLPADVIDIEFTPTMSNDSENTLDSEYAYLLSAHGFYTPLCKESREVAGDWVSKLDDDARSVLESLYTLKNNSSQKNNFDKNNKKLYA